MRFIILTQLAVNVFLLSSGVLFLLLACILYAIRLYPVRRLLLLGLFICACGTYFLMNDPALACLTGYPAAFSLVDAYSQYAITFFALAYVREFVSGWTKRLLLGCEIWTLLFVLAVSLLSRMGMLTHVNFTSVGAGCNVVFMLLFVFASGWEIFREKNVDVLRLLLSTVSLLIGGIIEVFNYLTGSIIRTAVFYFLGVLLFMVVQLFWFVRHLRDQAMLARRTVEMERELADIRVSIMLSQIQPHFLYNTLNSISALCRQDPTKAEETVDQLAHFLRGNLDHLMARDPIPFQKEKEHLELYLAIEKTRFGDALQIEYNYMATNFKLPSLTLQPIAENAVRYGVTKKKGGGTVRISTWENDGAFLLQVADDGVGFVVGERAADDRRHIGLENVECRLRAQCGGSLCVESELGKGTVVTITIPKAGAGNG